MKRLLTAAAALALMGGSYALAQTAPSAPSAPADGSTPPPASAPMDPSASSPAAPPAAPMGSPAAPMAPADPGAAPPPAAPMSGAATTADAPSAPPASYPPCTSKSQDRCTQTGKMMKSAGHKHHMMQKKAMKSDAMAPAADTGAAPAAPQ